MMHLVDLTVTIGPETLSPPSVNKRLTLTPSYRGPGYWRASSVDMVLHTGSHVDFSAHVTENGEVAADVGLERLCGQALVLDVHDLGPDQPITLERIMAAGAEVRSGDIVLVRTDWTERMWGTFPDYYLHSPYCTPEAAHWLLDRGARAIGFDCFSEYCARFPSFTSEDSIIHQIILQRNALLMQQMTNLSQLPLGTRFQFFAPCIKMSGAEGSPARFFALLDA
ncbi:MAG TPA: cyclase family protein [Ktedonobacteraceae bacterium]|jgi:arylformamidase|nr:cyclase family protein [Ktedonobacteraceae bacterium]